MYPGHWAAVAPDKPALIVSASTEMVTFAELNDRSNQLAQLMYAVGLRRGDRVAIVMENHPRYPEIVWAALRSGLYVTTVNAHLTPPEIAYIANDCRARVLISSARLVEKAVALPYQLSQCERFLMTDGAAPGYDRYEESIAAHPAAPLAEEPEGAYLLYSSGTTGRPKGVFRPLSARSIAEGRSRINRILSTLFGVDPETVYLSTAPLYHSAPLGFTIGSQALGGTVVLMDHFDPLAALRSIEQHRVTHSQWVPTMFGRLLRLPPDDRSRFDLSSHRVAIHAAAPCPREVKEQMFAWWGPILHEYYGGTELNGLTYVGPEDWLAHPGTVGRSVFGTIRICGDDGEELPPKEVGVVYFELQRPAFEYLGDSEKTRKAQHPKQPNWTTLGDMGWVDEDGFLYLTDRVAFTIVSGGVNIYPREVEDVLTMHPAVADVAVFGVPSEEFGEEVKAVVQPIESAAATPELEAEIIAFARERLAHFKCPRSVDFTKQRLRSPTGKLYKRELREPYWREKASRIV